MAFYVARLILSIAWWDATSIDQLRLRKERREEKMGMQFGFGEVHSSVQFERKFIGNFKHFALQSRFIEHCVGETFNNILLSDRNLTCTCSNRNNIYRRETWPQINKVLTSPRWKCDDDAWQWFPRSCTVSSCRNPKCITLHIHQCVSTYVECWSLYCIAICNLQWIRYIKK